MAHPFRIRRAFFLYVLAFALVGVPASAQNRAGVPAVPPPDRPVVLQTTDVARIRVVPIVGGLSHPWGMAFRRNGDILVTERDKGILRVIRDGQLLERSVPGVPEVYTDVRRAGLMDIAIHPDDDSLVYLTYSQAAELDPSEEVPTWAYDGQRGSRVALARGRLDGGALTEVRDLFVTNRIDLGVSASRIVFGPDGLLYMTVGGAIRTGSTAEYAQDPGTHYGKILRLRDDGTVPDDNPFVGNPDYLPEIYSLGHRNQIGLGFNPATGDLWATENAPQGGDEANVIKPGANYGWPIASYSREYSGIPVTETPWLEEFEAPEILWWPSIAPSGLTFYTGEHFPAWQGNLFVGAMRNRMPGRTGHLERIIFNRQGQEIRREWLLTELKQRIRDVRQGKDGYLYVLTEEADGVLLRIEPAHAIVDPPGNILTIERSSEARVSPLSESEWTAEQREIVERYAPDGNPGNALRTLIRVPALAHRVLPMLTYIANDSTLAPRHRAILILRTAWLTQSANHWATYASRGDLTDAEVLRVAQGPDEGWSEFEAVLIGLADELFRHSSVTAATWDRLSAQYDLPHLADAVVTVTEITAQAVLFNALGIQPDEATTARLPTTSVGYRVVVPDREPPLTTPRIDPVAGDGLRVSRTLRRHPALADQWSVNERYVLDPEKSRLTPHDRELLILRTGWNAQAVYEWAKHVGSVGRARDHGLDPLWIAQGGDADGWNANELTLIDAANEMYRDTTISDETWQKLSERYDTHQMMSIVWTTARYRRVSMTLNAFGVQPLPDDERFPELEGY